MHDLVIRGGLVVDGTGADPYAADIAVDGGTITEIGRITFRARTTIDADGALVTPGWIDAHTHYDGQATWDDQLVGSSSNGVTTVVFGNCGVGFAPLHPTDTNELISLMEGVEDIPGTALYEKIPWGIGRAIPNTWTSSGNAGGRSMWAGSCPTAPSGST